MSLSSKLSFGLYPKLKKRLTDETGGVQYAADSRDMSRSSSCRSSFDCPIRPIIDDAIIPLKTTLTSSIPTKPLKISSKATNYLRRTCSTITVSKSQVAYSPKKLLHTNSSVDIKSQNPATSSTTATSSDANNLNIPFPLFNRMTTIDSESTAHFNSDSPRALNSSMLLIPDGYDLTKTTSRQSQFSSTTQFTDAQSFQMKIIYDNNLMPGFVSPK